MFWTSSVLVSAPGKISVALSKVWTDDVDRVRSRGRANVVAPFCVCHWSFVPFWKILGGVPLEVVTLRLISANAAAGRRVLVLLWERVAIAVLNMFDGDWLDRVNHFGTNISGE